jgi:hypothetical protein
MNLKHHILDDIIKAVDKSGSHEIQLNVLEEKVFKKTHVPSRSTKEQILIWAVENGLLYKYKNNGNDDIVRFYKK